MRSFYKSSVLVCSAVFALTQIAAKKEDPKKPDTAAKPTKGTKGAKDGADADVMDLPVPKGQPQKGVKVPFYDSTGKLKMRFEIGIGTWLDEANIKMEKLRVEIFKEDGTTDFDIDLPDATLNKATKELTSQTNVKVKTAQYEITGHNMTFNIETKTGELGGGVKMTIYDKSSLSGDETAEKKTTVEFQPANEPAKPPTKIEIK